MKLAISILLCFALTVTANPFLGMASSSVVASGGGGGGITYDAATSQAYADNTMSKTLAHTQGSLTGGYVVLCVTMWDGATTAPTSATYDGSAMTLIASHSAASFGGQLRSYIYGLAVGTKGSGSYNGVVNFNSGCDEYSLGIVSYSGVHQSASVGTEGDGAGTSTSAAATVSSAAGELVIGAVSHHAASASPGGGETERYDATDGAFYEEAGAASVTITATLNTSAEWVITAVPLKPL